MKKPNNILSYFIKDIKDHKKRALYKQRNSNIAIEIFYKDKRIYQLFNYNTLKHKIILNYKNNFAIYYFNRRIINYKIDSNKKYFHKTLYYKKDNKLDYQTNNFVYYEFRYNKYFHKTYICYRCENEYILSIGIEYYNGYKYKYIHRYKYIYKYKYSYIFIMNKYELYYNNQFYYLFFVIRTY
jgi:hypothetical protein